MRRHFFEPARRVLTLTALFTTGLTMTGCSDDFYRLDQVQDIAVSEKGTGELEVRYRPLMESLYFSPGANVVALPDRLEIKFVRCGIKKECPHTHAAERESDGRSKLTLPRPTVPIYVSDGKTSAAVYPPR